MERYEFSFSWLGKNQRWVFLFPMTLEDATKQAKMSCECHGYDFLQVIPYQKD